MREMCWLSSKRHQFLVLHLREHSNEPWKIYTDSAHAVPDHRVPGASKGFATFQKLRQHGWTLIASKQTKPSNYLETSQFRNSQTNNKIFSSY